MLFTGFRRRVRAVGPSKHHEGDMAGTEDDYCEGRQVVLVRQPKHESGCERKNDDRARKNENFPSPQARGIDGSIWSGRLLGVGLHS